jgi:hypothetical protein
MCSVSFIGDIHFRRVWWHGLARVRADTLVQQDSHHFDKHAPLIEEGPYMDNQNKDD